MTQPPCSTCFHLGEPPPPSQWPLASCPQSETLCNAYLQERNEQLRKALAAKTAQLNCAQVTRQQQQLPVDPQAKEEKALAEKVTAIEQKSNDLALQLHNKVHSQHTIVMLYFLRFAR